MGGFGRRGIIWLTPPARDRPADDRLPKELAGLVVEGHEAAHDVAPEEQPAVGGNEAADESGPLLHGPRWTRKARPETRRVCLSPAGLGTPAFAEDDWLSGRKRRAISCGPLPDRRFPVDNRLRSSPSSLLQSHLSRQFDSPLNRF